MNFRFTIPKLTRIQSRFAASFLATALLVGVWIIWTLPHTAYSQSLSDHGGNGHKIKHTHKVYYDSNPDDYDDDDDDDDDGDDESVYADGGSAMIKGGGGGGGGGGYQEGIQQFDPLFMAQDIVSTPIAPSTLYDLEADDRNDDDGHEVMSEILQKRQDGFVRGLTNENPGTLNILPGEVQTWGYPSSQLFSGAVNPNNVGVKDRAVVTRTVYFTFNTCLQPVVNITGSGPPPQLTLYISNSTTNKNPGPGVTKPQLIFPVFEGFANATFNASTDIFISVVAANLTRIQTQFWTGTYNYELVASNQKPYHGYMSTPDLYLIDTDTTSALFISGNMSSISSKTNLTTLAPPYTIFANPISENWTNTEGLSRSFCGLQQSAKMGAQNAEISMTRRGLGHIAKEQVYLEGLNASNLYEVWLAKANNNTSGGVVFSSVNFTTKADGNCRVIYDLDFCSEVAYAVPSNATLFSDRSRLADFYDTYSHSWYANFTYSLQQIPCNTSLTSSYSLVRSCDDCANAYKTWLCAVTIPRCADFTSNATFLATRALGAGSSATKTFLDDGGIVDIEGAQTNGSTNGGLASFSRNVLIDEVVSPGAYKEIKPCMDLCYSLVQSCPASMGFACPRFAGESYGERSPDGDVTCSWLGAAYFLSDGERTWVGNRVWVVVVLSVVWSLLGGYL